MNLLITTGPTREPLDDVRFLSNGSSGRMGAAVALAAAGAGHDVTLLAGCVCPDVLAPAEQVGCRIERFVTVADLQRLLAERFPACDALVMAAAVGDFRPEAIAPDKLARADGPVTLTLQPTPDLLAGVGASKKPGQVVVAFAVEVGPPERASSKARAELAAKSADVVVVNSPAAMGATMSDAAILAPDDDLLPWSRRSKDELASHLVGLLGDGKPQ